MRTNLEFNILREKLKRTDFEARQFREVLEQIASQKRRTRESRLASSCLGFVDSIMDQKPKLEKI